MKMLVISVLCICLTSGGLTHLYDIYINGFLPYKFVPFWLNAYWTSLGLLDFIAAYLLIRKLKIGIFLMLAIMFSDVIINSCAYYFWGFIDHAFPLQLQSAFLGFALASSVLLWKNENTIEFNK